MPREVYQLRSADLRPLLHPTVRRNAPLAVFAYTELGKARSLECTILAPEVFGEGDDDEGILDIREGRLAARVGLVARKVGYGTRYFFRCPRSGEPVTTLIVIGDEIGSAASMGFRSTNQTRKQRILLDERSRLLDLTTKAAGAPSTELVHQLWAVERKLQLPKTPFELADHPQRPKILAQMREFAQRGQAPELRLGVGRIFRGLLFIHLQRFHQRLFTQ